MDQNNDINQIPPYLRDFLSSLITEAGIVVDEVTHNQIIKELFVQLDNYILSVIIEKLPGDKLEEFTKMAEEGKNREELEEYLSKNIQDSQQVFSQALMDFKNLYLGNVAVARSAPPGNEASETSSTPASVPENNNNTDTKVD